MSSLLRFLNVFFYLFDDIFGRLDTIHERDRWTDGWTPADSKDRAYAYVAR